MKHDFFFSFFLCGHVACDWINTARVKFTGAVRLFSVDDAKALSSTGNLEHAIVDEAADVIAVSEIEIG